MKKLLITSFLTLAASLAYAGGSCCDKATDSKDKDAGKSGAVEAPATLACGGDKGDKDEGSKAESNAISQEFAGSDCSGDKGDKQCGEKSGVEAVSDQLAGSGCGGDKGDKQCGEKSGLDSVSSQFAGSGCGGDKGDEACGKKSEGLVVETSVA